MKSLKVLCACFAALAFVACNQDDSVESAEFKLVSSINSLTRTPELDGNGAGRFVNGDQNSLFFHNGSRTLYSFNYEYGQTYYWDDIKVPAETQNSSLSACYPTVSATDPKNFDWNVESHAGSSDFLFAAPVNVKINSASPVSLVFTHALHKLVVELVPDGTSVTEDMLAQSEIQVRNFHPVATLNLLEAKAVAAKGNLTNASAKSKKASFILPAQEVGTMEVLVKVGERTAVYKLSACEVAGESLKNLASGKTFSLKIKVSQNAFTIIGQNISGWDNQGSFEGSVII